MRFKPHFSCLSSSADSCKLIIISNKVHKLKCHYINKTYGVTFLLWHTPSLSTTPNLKWSEYFIVIAVVHLLLKVAVPIWGGIYQYFCSYVIVWCAFRGSTESWEEHASADESYCWDQDYHEIEVLLNAIVPANQVDQSHFLSIIGGSVHHSTPPSYGVLWMNPPLHIHHWDTCAVSLTCQRWSCRQFPKQRWCSWYISKKNRTTFCSVPDKRGASDKAGFLTRQNEWST